MAKQIDPIKKERYKRARLKGKGKGDALIEAGISKVSARHNQNRLSMAKLGDEELLREFKAENVTVKKRKKESVTLKRDLGIKNLEETKWILEQE